MPTNQEMLVDFTNTAHDVFVAAFEHDMQHKMPDAFQEKPLSALFLQVIQKPYRTGQVVSGEELVVDPLHEYDVAGFDHHLKLRELPEDVRDHYIDVARKMAGLTLTDAFVASTEIPTGGLTASWSLTYSNGKRRHVDTFKEKPAKQSIAAAQYFAEQALADVISPEPKMTAAERLIAIITGAEEADDDKRHMDRRFMIRPVAGLPLNGHESTPFLESYAANMFRSAMICGERIERHTALGSPEIFLTLENERYELLNSSYLRAAEILDRRSL